MKNETITAIKAILSADETVTDETFNAVLKSCNSKPTKKRMITVRKAAEILECHPRTVQRYVRMGLLKPSRITKRRVRYDLDEVERLLQDGSGIGPHLSD